MTNKTTERRVDATIKWIGKECKTHGLTQRTEYNDDCLSPEYLETLRGKTDGNNT